MHVNFACKYNSLQKQNKNVSNGEKTMLKRPNICISLLATHAFQHQHQSSDPYNVICYCV